MLLKMFYKCLDWLQVFELSDMPGMCINSSNIDDYLANFCNWLGSFECQGVYYN